MYRYLGFLPPGGVVEVCADHSDKSATYLELFARFLRI